MQKLSNIILNLDDDESLLLIKCAKLLKVDKKSIKKIKILKKSVDARKRNDIKIVYSVGVYFDDEVERVETFENISTDKKVVIIGAGPSGLFCGLYLARHGIKPIIIERGESVDERSKTVNNFISGNDLNLDSNVQFGEGGAGTFSDGKLNTGVNNRLIDVVLRDFVTFGAPSEIEYIAKPHIGSDNLKTVVKNIRNEIISLGGEVHFNEKFIDFSLRNQKVFEVTTTKNKYPCDYLVLAIGHSARDTFEMLYKKSIFIEQKEFAVGFRVEQLQSVINELQYGKFSGHKKLKSADFKLVTNALGRGVFSFCMCPGGVVIPSQSEGDTVVVNGMSNFARDEENGNSAIICQVRKTDFESSSALSGVEFQRMLEKKAFLLGGKNYQAPVQLAQDFINNRKTTNLLGVKPSYSRGYELTSMESLFPKEITNSLKQGLADMDKKLKGIASAGAVLTGVESRTSSPIRIVRGDNFQSVSVKGLFPCGEGCGYAGGIMSASIDGIKVCEKIIEEIKKSIL